MCVCVCVCVVVSMCEGVSGRRRDLRRPRASLRMCLERQRVRLVTEGTCIKPRSSRGAQYGCGSIVFAGGGVLLVVLLLLLLDNG